MSFSDSIFIRITDTFENALDTQFCRFGIVYVFAEYKVFQEHLSRQRLF